VRGAPAASRERTSHRKERGMGIFATFGIGIIFAFILMVIIGGLLMWVAAKIARVENSSLGRAMAAAVATSFVTVLASFLFKLVPVLGDLFGFIAGLVLAILVIKENHHRPLADILYGFFNCSYRHTGMSPLNVGNCL
jgi:hypothetical protein